MAAQGVKRKRTKNTSPDQLKLYLNFMENDYIFRSNTINPTVDPNYLTKKWEELAGQLNALGNGPSLSVEEWKKKFLDWKYATKSKYRKIKTLSIGTGGGLQSTISLNDLEERGLSVWGKVAVAGASHVTTYEGLEIPDLQPNPEPNAQPHKTCEPSASTSQSQGNESFEVIYLEHINEEDKENITTTQKPEKNIKRKKTKPLSILSENLIENSKNLTETNEKLVKILENYSKNNIELKKNKIELQKQNLQFEVEKFIFLHPQFDFNLE